jgi:CcmD family protein
MKYFILITLLLSSFVDLWAQDETSVFRTSGKIYVVVGIIAIIFILIVAYLIRLDKKIAQLENKNNS